MATSGHYELEVQERKDALHATLTAWCRREGKSRADFADALSLATGQRVTEVMIAHWLKRDELKRQMPAPMDLYWRQITRPLPLPPTREVNAAMQAIDWMEAQA